MKFQREHISLRLFLVLTLMFSLGFSLPATQFASTHHKQAKPCFSSQTIVSQPKVTTGFGQLPLYFEANRGQTDEKVKFLSRQPQSTLFLTNTEAVLVLSKSRKPKIKPFAKEKSLVPTVSEPMEADVVRMQMVGANPGSVITGLNQTPAKVNYYLGNDPAQWQVGVPTFSRVSYKDIYPGIDLVYYDQEGQLEFDFVVAPGKDPNAIRLNWTGAQKVEVDQAGNLLLDVNGKTIVQHAPLIYQQSEAGRTQVVGRYTVESGKSTNEHQIGFLVGNYDTQKPLVIDPVLTYSTYLGGSAEDKGYSIAVDGQGQAHIFGRTYSTNFPTQNALSGTLSGSVDAFVTKLNAAGNGLIFSTYLGGSAGEAGEEGGITLDGSGNIIVASNTGSSNFPTTLPYTIQGAGINDLFISKLNASGAMVDSAVLGGVGEDYARAVAADTQGNIFVTGFTTSNLESGGSLQSPHAYLLKFISSGGNSQVKMIGNAASAYQEHGYGVAVTSGGVIFVVGTTDDPNFPLLNPYQNVYQGVSDGFVAAYTLVTPPPIPRPKPPVLTRQYSTYLGGSGPNGEGACAVTVDSAGAAYVTGTTTSVDFPTVNPFLTSGSSFLTKITGYGTNGVAYSTYLDLNSGKGVALDSNGAAFVCGGTSVVGVRKINPTGSGFDYSFTVGNGEVKGIAVDSNGNAYVTGNTNSTSFPTVNAFQGSYQGGTNDAFVSKISPNTPSATVSQFYPVASYTGKTLTITGTNFAPGTQVYFGGTRMIAATTTYVNSTTLQVVVPASSSGTGNVNGYLTIQVPGLSTITTLGIPANAPNPGNPSATFPEFVLWGDSTLNGVVGTNDLTLVNAYIQGQVSFNANQLLAGDVDPLNGNGSRGDGSVNSSDAAFLQLVLQGSASF